MEFEGDKPIQHVNNVQVATMSICKAKNITDQDRISIITYLQSLLQIWLAINLILNYTSQLQKNKQNKTKSTLCAVVSH